MVKSYDFHGGSRLLKVAYIEVFLRMASVVIWVGDHATEGASLGSLFVQ
jgi:hypothetical protein